MPIIRVPSVKAEMGFSSSTSVYNAVNAGLLTKPVLIGLRAVGWPLEEVQAIVAARIAGCTDDQIRDLVMALHAKRAELLGDLAKLGWSAQ